MASRPYLTVTNLGRDPIVLTSESRPLVWVMFHPSFRQKARNWFSRGARARTERRPDVNPGIDYSGRGNHFTLST